MMSDVHENLREIRVVVRLNYTSTPNFRISSFIKAQANLFKMSDASKPITIGYWGEFEVFQIADCALSFAMLIRPTSLYFQGLGAPLRMMVLYSGYPLRCDNYDITVDKVRVSS